MRGWLVIVVVAGLVAAFAWLTGTGLLLLGPGLLILLVAYQNNRSAQLLGPGGRDEPTRAPLAIDGGPSIDLGEELLDLLTSARQRAARSLEDHARLDPFVMYEEADGDVRIRPVRPDGDDGLARGRETARSIDASAPRVVLVVTGRAVVDGDDRAVVRYEAAERRFQDRTLVFVERITPRRWIIPASTSGRVAYVGDGGHTLRFAAGPDGA